MRVEACDALGRIGVYAEPAVPKLIAVLEQGRPGDVLRDLRPRASGALGQIGGAAEGAIPHIERSLVEDVVNAPRAIWIFHVTQDPRVKALAQLGAVEELLRLRKASHDGFRCEVAEALGTVEPSTEAVARGLAEMLADPDESVRRTAAFALAEATPKFPLVVDPLTKATRDASEPVRAAAATALARYDQKPGDKLATIVPFLLSIDATASQNARAAIEKLGAAALPLLNATIDDEKAPEAHRAAAVAGLSAVSFDQHHLAVERARQILGDAKSSVAMRGLAAAMLRHGRPADPRIGPALLAALEAARDDGLQNTLAGVSSDLDSAEVGSVLAKKLVLSNGKPCVGAFMAIGQLGPKAKGAVPALVGYLGDEHGIDGLQPSAILALGAIGPDAQAAVPGLLPLLRNSKIPGIPERAARSLAQVAPDARKPEVATAIMAALDRAQRDFLGEVELAKSLSLLGPSARPGIPRLLKLTEDPYLIDDVAEMLAAFVDESDADALLPKFSPYLKKAEKYDALAVVALLPRFGAKAKPAIPAVVALLETFVDYDRTKILKSLAAIGPEALPTVAGLAKQHADRDVRARAVKVLPEFGVAAVPALTDVVAGGKDEELRLEALAGLVGFGPRARSAAPILRQVRDQANPLLRDAIDEAVTAIEGADPGTK